MDKQGGPNPSRGHGSKVKSGGMPMLNRRARSSRLWQILTPWIEIAVHKLDDFLYVRIHLEEDADSPRVVLSRKDTRLK